MGRLWKVLSEEDNPHVVPSPEDEIKDDDHMDLLDSSGRALDEEGNENDELTDRERRLARAPDLTLPMHRLFLTPLPSDGPDMLEPSHLGSPEMQLETMEKAFAILREVQDDSREYVERLDEIREGLGDVKRQRDLIWLKSRKQALKELQAIEQIAVDEQNEM